MRTKIVATIGPASASRDGIHALAEIGVDVVRVNFAHSAHESAARIIEWTREAAAAVGKPMAVLADLAGPKIRIGDLPEPVMLHEHREVVLAPERVAEGDELPTTYADLAQDIEPGSRILLDDGIMELRVRAIDAPRVTCEVVRGGLLYSHKGMNLPGVRVSAPALTQKDIDDLAFALAHDVDYIGLSFVQRAGDIRDLRARVPATVLIVAKIEKDTALEDIEPILGETDAVMVARGDLGVELPFEKVPVAQKRIVQLANLFGRPVITATQMLESMISSPRPTRAEASDVANALFDGTDAVMLSGETATGRYPLLAVEAMTRIANEIEHTRAYAEGPKYDVPSAPRHATAVAWGPRVDPLRSGATPTQHAVAAATVKAVSMLEAPAIISFTRTGSTTRLVSSYRPPVPILGVTDQEKTWRQLALVWGVRPVMCPKPVTYESMLSYAREYLFANGLARPGQRVVVTAGVPFHVPGTTNMMRIEQL